MLCEMDPRDTSLLDQGLNVRIDQQKDFLFLMLSVRYVLSKEMFAEAQMQRVSGQC